MTTIHSADCRRPHQVTADEAYCRLRSLLDDDPGVFTAQCDGLAVDAGTVEGLLFAPLDVGAAALPRATVVATAKADGWLLKASARGWLLHPEAFGCTEEPPAGVRDARWVEHTGSDCPSDLRDISVFPG